MIFEVVKSHPTKVIQANSHKKKVPIGANMSRLNKFHKKPHLQ